MPFPNLIQFRRSEYFNVEEIPATNLAATPTPVCPTEQLFLHISRGTTTSVVLIRAPVS